MKILRRAAMTLVCLIGLCAVSCAPPEPKSGTMLLVVGSETPAAYTVRLDDVDITEGVLSVLEYLRERDGLEFTAETGGYGAFLTKVGSLEQDAAAGIYLYLYTSVNKDFDVSAYAQTVEYDGKTLTSAGVGVSEMTVEDGCVVYVGTIRA